MKKIIIQFVFIFTLLYLLFNYNYEIKLNLFNSLINIMKNIIPSMFPIIFIVNYINENIYIKNKLIKFISLAISFAPSNAILSENKKELIFSTNINPLFSYIILKEIFGFNIAIKIILINLLINYIFLFSSIKNVKYIKKEKKTITFLIKKTTEAIINISGIIIFFNILLSIITIITSLNIISLIEICNGFNLIKNFQKYKLFYGSLLNSFGGLAIYFQMKTINEKVDKKFILYKFLLSLLTTIITMFIIKI